MNEIKYLLIEYADCGDPFIIRIFDTDDQRVKATREAILGEDNEGAGCPELNALREEGICHFEGDPSLEWRNGIVIDESAPQQPTDTEAGKPKPHNPDNLTPEEWGEDEGWRILCDDERPFDYGSKSRNVQMWCNGTWIWADGESEICTYRTRESRASLRRLRGLPEEGK